MLAQREGQEHKIFVSAVDPGTSHISVTSPDCIMGAPLLTLCVLGWVQTDMGGAGATRTVEEGIDTMVWLATLSQEELPWNHNGVLWNQKKVVPW